MNLTDEQRAALDRHWKELFEDVVPTETEMVAYGYLYGYFKRGYAAAQREIEELRQFVAEIGYVEFGDDLLGFTTIVDENAEPDTVTVAGRKELDYAARIAELEAENTKLTAEVAAANKGAAINAKTNQLLADRVSYLSRCYRYERPQAGRYREFWQWGCESFGGDAEKERAVMIRLLQKILDDIGVDYWIAEQVKRGLDYYVEDGFEAIADYLGAQKQIAGGGAYQDGVGFAIGIDRVLLALEMKV